MIESISFFKSMKETPVFLIIGFATKIWYNLSVCERWRGFYIPVTPNIPTSNPAILITE